MRQEGFAKAMRIIQDAQGAAIGGLGTYAISVALLRETAKPGTVGQLMLPDPTHIFFAGHPGIVADALKCAEVQLNWYRAYLAKQNKDGSGDEKWPPDDFNPKQWGQTE